MRASTPVSIALVALTSLVACGGAATPAPAATADAGAPLAVICANLLRHGCGGAMCERELRALYDSVPPRCGAQRDAYFACAARSTATGCLSNDATYAMCAALNEAVTRCAGPIDAGRPADLPELPDAPSLPDAGASKDASPTSDADTPDDTPRPEDAPAPTCPPLAGRFEATGGGRFATICPSGTFTLARSTSGAACRYDLTFENGGTDPFAMSAAHVDVDAELNLTGAATVTDGSGTRVGQLTGGMIEMGQGGVLSIDRGGDECGWRLVRLP